MSPARIRFPFQVNLPLATHAQARALQNRMMNLMGTGGVNGLGMARCDPESGRTVGLSFKGNAVWCVNVWFETADDLQDFAGQNDGLPFLRDGVWVSATVVGALRAH